MKQAHGIRGQIHVVADGNSLRSLKQIWLGEKAYQVLAAQAVPDGFLLRLDQVNTRNASEPLKGQTVYGARAALPKPDEDEYYVTDLMGCAVYDLEQKYLGQVTGNFHSGAQEILEISGEENFLLPFVDPIIQSVLTAEKKIICDPPEGLTTINRTEKSHEL